MKITEEFKYTTNLSVYNKSRIKLLARSGVLWCELCSPNKGCNNRRKFHKRDNRNWKRYRKKQYKL